MLHNQKVFLMKLISFGNRRNHLKQDLADRLGVLICLQGSSYCLDIAEGEGALY